jgi:hypothetical protein
MTVAFVCEGCDRAVHVPAAAAGDGSVCPGCGRTHGLLLDPSAAGPRCLESCLRCGLDRLYVQKDFNRKIGLAVFVVAAVLSVPTWGLSLLAATLIDLALYYALGDVTVCYGCGAQHRGFVRNPAHAAYDLHVAESIERRPRTA